MSKILLDPNAFDALHLSALEFGGISAGQDFAIARNKNGNIIEDSDSPCCIRGHAKFIGMVELENGSRNLWNYLTDVGINVDRNDQVIDKHCKRKKEKDGLHRVFFCKVDWETYCKIMGIDIISNTPDAKEDSSA